MDGWWNQSVMNKVSGGASVFKSTNNWKLWYDEIHNLWARLISQTEFLNHGCLRRSTIGVCILDMTRFGLTPSHNQQLHLLTTLISQNEIFPDGVIWRTLTPATGKTTSNQGPWTSWSDPVQQRMEEIYWSGLSAGLFVCGQACRNNKQLKTSLISDG